MSITSWKREFYRTPADSSSLSTDEKKLEHSIKKWEGFKKANLAKHKITWAEIEDHDLCHTTTCALCQTYYFTETPCEGCPVAKVNLSCWLERSAYLQSRDKNNPSYMLAALRKALKKIKSS